MPALGYKAESLGIPGLSNAERVNAPKQKFTNVAVMKQNPYPSKWEQVGKAVHQATQTAISGFQAVASHYNYERAELINKEMVDDAYVTAVTNDGAANITSIFTAEAVAKSKGIPVNPADTLSAYTSARDKLYLDITNNKHMSTKAKQKAMLNVDKLFNDKIMQTSKAVELQIKAENVKRLKKIVLNTTTQQIAATDVSIDEIVNTNKTNLKALETNGVSTDVFAVLSDTISMYSDNESIIYKRYDEAKKYLQDITEGKKELPEGFVKYLNTLTSYKNKLDENKAKVAKHKESAIKQDADRRLKYMEINGAVAIDNVNFKGITDISLEEYFKNGTTSKLFTYENFDKLRASVEASVETSTKELAIKAGYDPKKYDEYKKRLTDKVLLKQFSLHLKNTLGADVPLDVYPKEYRAMATEDLKEDINYALSNGLIDTIHDSFVTNPKEVKAVVQKNLTTDFYHLMGNITQENFGELRKQFVSKYGNIDKTIAFSGLPANLKLQVETFMNTSDYKAATVKINDIKETDITKVKLLGEPDALTKLRGLPYFLGKDAEEYFKLKVSTGGGFVTEEDVEEYTKAHTLKIGTYGFRDTIYFDNDVNEMVPNEDDKSLALDVFKSTLGIVNFNGTHITTSNGSVVIENEKGIVVGAIQHKAFMEKLNAMKADITYRKLKEKQWSKMEDEASWTSTGFNLGKMDSYIDKPDGTRIYKKNFLEQ